MRKKPVLIKRAVISKKSNERERKLLFAIKQMDKHVFQKRYKNAPDIFLRMPFGLVYLSKRGMFLNGVPLNKRQAAQVAAKINPKRRKEVA